MIELYDAIESVGRHLIGRYENGFRLSLCPTIESLIVEIVTLLLIIYVGILVRNIAINHAILRYLESGIIKHTACNRHISPPRIEVRQAVLSLSILQAMQGCWLVALRATSVEFGEFARSCKFRPVDFFF